ncbi:TetR-like C-terminal domain-containing protein [Leifsonia kafniensis]|uniref:TetR-like C-terminal domain-containing protein n=1 Tax=Leifsonia kafniensis TaxID=475957 RepID=UPI0031EDB2E3
MSTPLPALRPAPRRGRPIDVALGERVFKAVLEQLSTVGYPRLEIETVAADAGCSKTTIYRRWGTKPHLVAAAIASEYVGQSSSVIDNGNLLDDLVEHVRVGPSFLKYGRLAPVAWTAMLEPEVAEFLREEVLNGRDAIAEVIFDRAIERGELPADADSRTILHTALGLGLYERYLAGSSLVEATLRQVIAALIATPPRLAAPLAAEEA